VTARLVLIVATVGACGREPTPQEAAVPRVQESRGFGRAKSVPDSLSPAQQAKLERLARETQEPTVELTVEMRGRRVPKAADGGAALDVYVDGKLAKTVAASTLEGPATLADLMRRYGMPTPRNLLVHGETRDLWVPWADAARFWLRVNKRGGIKLDPAATASAPVRRGPGSATGPGVEDVPKRAVRSLEVRGVAWIDVRTMKAPLLVGEPAAGKTLGAPGGAGSGGGRGVGAGGGGGQGGGQRRGQGRGEPRDDG